MVWLAGSTGLRRGELIALRWRDMEFDANLANITHSVWHNVEGNTKTEAPRKPVPSSSDTPIAGLRSTSISKL
jgi:integrase